MRRYAPLDQRPIGVFDSGLGGLTAGRQTIISTNLYEADIEERYGGQIASRLAGEYEQLVFAGSDIRRLKKERGL